jgi:alpha-tubulin suppressor-like RCC1 family protein
MIRRALSLVAVAAIASLAACEDDDLTGPGFICDVTNPVRDVVIATGNTQVLVHSPALPTDTVVLSAFATSRFGNARSDVPIEFSSSDNSIATVDEAGVVRALRAGTVRITASACGESSAVDVTVLANIVSVTVTPGSDTVVAGDSATFAARAIGQGGAIVRNVKFTFSSPTSSVTIRQTSDSTAVVTSPLQAGTYVVNATAEGVTGAASLLALPRIFVASTAPTSGIDVGDLTSCGLITDGQGFCWGLNDHGQVGAATDSVCFEGVSPGEVENDTTETITTRPCRLLPVRVAPDLAFTQMSAGDSTTCGIAVSGRAYCWGNGSFGTIGNGKTSSQEEPSLVTTALTFSSISVGGQHACGLTPGGLAYCWGADSLGQLGDSRVINSTTPIPVTRANQNTTFASISAGWRHTCALTPAGQAWCWGSNERGQLGIGADGGAVDAPVAVQTSVAFASISAGGDHTCAITTAGSAFCWGSNLHGQLGNAVVGQSNVPVPSAAGLTFTRISASTGTASTIPLPIPEPWKVVGRGHTCGITAGGAAYCWGDNTDLQLGNGPFSGGPQSANSSPMQVATSHIPGGASFVTISAGSRHSCAVAADGAGYCWGANVYGALGNTEQANFRGLAQRVATPR